MPLVGRRITALKAKRDTTGDYTPALRFAKPGSGSWKWSGASADQLAIPFYA